MSTTYEDNAEVLASIAAEGNDLTQPVTVDFIHFFADEASAEAFAEAVEVAGFETSTLPAEDADDVWEVTAWRTMVPTCEAITEVEEQLEGIAQEHDGESDGWGFVGA